MGALGKRERQARGGAKYTVGLALLLMVAHRAGSEAVRPRHSQQAVARRGKTTGGVRGGLRAADGRGRFLQEEDDEEETTTDGDLDGDDDETTAPEEGTTDEGTTDEGTTDEGTTDEGTTDEGTTDEGTIDDVEDTGEDTGDDTGDDAGDDEEEDAGDDAGDDEGEGGVAPTPVGDDDQGDDTTSSVVDEGEDIMTPSPIAEEEGEPTTSTTSLDEGDDSESSTPVTDEGDDDETPTPVVDGGEEDGSAAPVAAEPVGPTPSPVDPGTAAPYAPSTCSNGMPGVSDGSVCCKEECGMCGGPGCGAVVGTNGASDCCPGTIVEESGGEFCGDAPCVMSGFTPSPVNPAFDGTAAPVEPSTCSNGLPGYQDGDACCVESCGQCGGAGCGTIPGTGGSSNCCSSAIRETGTVCGEPPCIIEGFTPAPAVIGDGTVAPSGGSSCSNGFLGYQDGPVCCAANCGQCGGAGCGAVAGTAGSAACCSSIIAVEGESCDVTGEAPCIIDGYTPAPVVPDYGSSAPVVPSMCFNGMAGYQEGDVCCLEACGQCGGAGCGTVPGTGGSEFCCSSTIRETGELCGNGVEAPCIMTGFTPSPVNPATIGTAAPVAASTCINGLAGVQNGAACCAENCGQCGGEGCGVIPGTGGADNCCASKVLEANVVCAVGVEAPCVIENYTPAPAGVPGQAAPFAASTCTNGLAGVQEGAACCEEKCGQCGGAGCGTLPGTPGPDSCCSTTIMESGVPCDFGVEAPCFITNYTPAPAVVDGVMMPFAASTCTNGFAGVQDANVCCAENCGQCGGAGCGTLPGTGGSDFCCSSTIAVNGTDCSITGEAPCIMGAWVPTPAPLVIETAAPVPFSNCSNGLAGYQDGDVCCKLACGLCGGDGCGKVNGTEGSSDCCPGTISLSNQTCGGQIVAPCIIPLTPAPTAAPAVTPVPTPTPFVSANAEDLVNGSNARVRGPGVVVSFVSAACAIIGVLALGAHQLV